MKLRNKKTGQEGNFIINKDHFECVDLEYVPEYNSLAELNAEWEDVPEEPKEYWFLSGKGEVICIADVNTVFDKEHKAIGNYFETEEEAEKIVEKLKAYKRLKDKGFRFHSWSRNQTGTIDIFCTWSDIPPLTGFIQDDLNLLFGGEE